MNTGLFSTRKDFEEPSGVSSSKLEEAIGIILKSEEEGQPMELADWLGRNPDQATELASFLASHRKMQTVALTRWADESVVVQPSTFPKVAGLDLQEEIGRGGMGVVYRAYDPTLKRTVAVKRIIASLLTSPKELEKFRFEAEAAAGLDHAAIVPIHAFGETDGQPFLVMKFMEGGSLSNRLRALGHARQLPQAEAAKLVRDIAFGVHHAHQRGLIHRDLKPANILLDHLGAPHVADFGLAIALKASFSISRDGSMAGTAAYMAPEQVSCETGLTIAVDVHALGSILYELLAGEPPFGRGEWLQTIQRVRDEPAPSLRHIRPELARDLETIAMRCLEKRPEDRYRSALNLAEDLTRFLEGEPLVSKPRSLATTIVRAIDRRKETRSMASWPGCFVAAISLLLSHSIVQFVALTDGQPWVAYTALGAYFVAWLSLYWWFLIVRSHALSPVERLSAALQIGMMLACLSLFPAHIVFYGKNFLPIYPPMTTIFGLGIFAHGATHWGRLYVVGLVLMVVSCLMPLVPMIFWPATHTLMHGGILVWMGFWLRQFDRESQARPSKSIGEAITIT